MMTVERHGNQHVQNRHAFNGCLPQSSTKTQSTILHYFPLIRPTHMPVCRHSCQDCQTTQVPVTKTHKYRQLCKNAPEIKVKDCHIPHRSIGEVLVSVSYLPILDLEPAKVWNIPPVQCQAYGYLPTCRASPPNDWLNESQLCKLTYCWSNWKKMRRIVSRWAASLLSSASVNSLSRLLIRGVRYRRLPFFCDVTSYSSGTFFTTLSGTSIWKRFFPLPQYVSDCNILQYRNKGT